MSGPFASQSQSINNSPSSKLAKLNPKPIGFNFYSMLYEDLKNIANSVTNRASQLAYIKSAGANMVRVMVPCSSTSELLTLVHNTATMPLTMSDGNLRPEYVAALDLMFSDANAYGIKLHISDFWDQDLIPDAQGESRITGYVSTTTKTAVYMRSAAQWFFNRYKDHPAFGVYSIGNEYVTDESGAAGPTNAQLGAFFTFLADSCKDLSQNQLFTADITPSPIAVTNTRETVGAAIDRYNILFAGLDAYCFHFYSELHNYIGRTSYDNAQFANSTTTTVGYEGMTSLIASYKAAADAAGKPFIVGEFGVNTGNELDTASVKKNRTFKAVADSAVYGMVWNVQDSVIAGSSGQSTWFIQPGTDRGNTFLALAQQYNKGTARNPKQRTAAITGLRQKLAPQVYMSTTRTAGALITATSTAAHQATNLAILGWFRIDAALNAFEALAKFVDASGFNGFNIVGNATAGVGDFYFEFRGAAGGAGSTSGNLPAVVDLTWHHYACSYEVLEGGTAITIWRDGIYWQTKVTSAALTAMAVGTNMRLMGNTSGAPFSMQDFCLATSITSEDVWAHMRGEILPQSLMHVRALPNKTILDLSINRTALTVGAGVTVTLN